MYLNEDVIKKEFSEFSQLSESSEPSEPSEPSETIHTDDNGQRYRVGPDGKRIYLINQSPPQQPQPQQPPQRDILGDVTRASMAQHALTNLGRGAQNIYRGVKNVAMQGGKLTPVGKVGLGVGGIALGGLAAKRILDSRRARREQEEAS